MTAGDMTIMAMWDEATDNGSEVTGYEVQHREMDKDWPTTPSRSGTISPHDKSTMWTISNLENGTEYEVRVRAYSYSARDDDTWSDVKKATPVAGGTPTPDPPDDDTDDTSDAPTGVEVTGGAGMLTVAWTDIDDANISEYNVRKRTVEGNALGSWLPSAMGKSFSGSPAVFTDLDAGVTYEAQVRGVWSDGMTTEWSESATGTTEAAPVERLGEVDFTAMAGNGSIMVEWKTLEGATYYNVEWSVDTQARTPDTFHYIDDPKATTYMIENVVNGTPYAVRVRAGDANGLGRFPEAVIVTPSADAPMPTPALPLAGMFLLGAGLVAGARKRMRQRQLRA